MPIITNDTQARESFLNFWNDNINHNFYKERCEIIAKNTYDYLTKNSINRDRHNKNLDVLKCRFANGEYTKLASKFNYHYCINDLVLQAYLLQN